MKTLLVQVPKDKYKGEFKITVEATVSPGDFDLTDSIEFVGPSAYSLK